MSDYPLCQSCGMPMKTAPDHGGGQTDNACCVHCCDDVGDLKSREQVKAGMIALAMRTMEADKAEAMVDEVMDKMPAWSVIRHG